MNNIQEINNIFKGLDFEKINISKTSDSKWGDYQTNLAMMYFKKVKQRLGLKNPREFGNYIINQVNNNINVSKMELAGPGFINITLSDKYLENFINLITKLNQPIFNKIDHEKKVIIDYSSPNVAKEMHVGHLRSTIIGDVIGNFYQLKGYQVERINHIGDWGTQFGMLIAYIQDKNIDLNDNYLGISNLHKWYKESKIKFDNDINFNKKAHQNVVDLQSGNLEHLKIWKRICQISESSYQKIYTRLNVSSDLKIFGESFYNNMLEDIVSDLYEKGLLKNEENEAKLLFIDDDKPPLIVKKSDGGFGYDATDLAALKYRLFNLDANKIIYVTDSGQSLHFELLFKAAEKAGWLKDQELVHVPFGIVLGDDGKRIKSRSGDSIKLTELLDEASKIYLKNNLDRKENDSCLIKDESIEYISKLIGWNAVKYADLRHNRNNDYQFDYHKMLDFKGDTLIYQLYSWVRINNLFKKTKYTLENIKITKFIFSIEVHQQYLTERSLVIHLSQFDEILDKIIESLLPNYLCEYIYQLSMKINDFWRDCPVIDDKNELTRLKLCLACKIVMETCFNLLKIPVEEIERL
jgi:arginyl-tRNA synthetase